MKEFRKNQEGYFVCEECGKTYKTLSGLMSHAARMHGGKRKYYSTWIFENGEGVCKQCGKETLMHGQDVYLFCSIRCSSIYNFKKYGNQLNTERANMKRKKTNLNKYGHENPWGNKQVQEKREKTWVKKYGVRNPAQNREIYEKSLKTRRQVKQFRDTDLTYQGSYELDFLEKFYDKIDIENGPSISYLFEGKNKVYHSDFYIPSKNLVIEIKSDYILSLDEEINYKKQACVKQGYNYMLVLNKNYKNINVAI